MQSHGPSGELSDRQPTLGRSVVAVRAVGVVAWAIGFAALILERETGSETWYWFEFSMYAALLPLGLVLSATLRNRQRDLDGEWAHRLSELATHDELTGLFNRRHFNTEIDRLASECLVAGTPLSLAFVDLNDFKTINDSYGHEAGDLALCAAGRCLLERTGDRGLVFRTGGDEFGVILPGTSEADAQALFGPVCRMSPILLPGNRTCTVSGTVGIASMEGSMEIETLLRTADGRLYDKKGAQGGARRAA